MVKFANIIVYIHKIIEQILLLDEIVIMLLL
jgi:hypothetical protein